MFVISEYTEKILKTIIYIWEFLAWSIETLCIYSIDKPIRTTLAVSVQQF